MKQIKMEAKRHLKENQAFYYGISRNYFLFCLLGVLSPFIVVNLSQWVTNASLSSIRFSYQQNVWTTLLTGLWSYILICVFSFQIYLKTARTEVTEIVRKKQKMKFFYLVGLMLLTQFPFTFAMDMINNYTKTQKAVQSGFLVLSILKLVLPILLFVLRSLLYFAACEVALFPEKSLKCSVIDSVKLFIKNIFNCLYFNLTFILWYIIPITVGLILIVMTGSIQPGTNQNQVSLLMSLLSFLSYPFMFGAGMMFFPYYHISKMNFYRELLRYEDRENSKRKKKR